MVRAGSGHGFLRGGLGVGLVRVARAPGLISVHGTVLAGPGDMMIDGVVPLGCGRAGLSRLSAPDGLRAWRAGMFRGVGDGGMATVHRRCEGRRFHPHRPHRRAGRGGVGLVAEAAQDAMGAAGEFAGDRQGSPVGVDRPRPPRATIAGQRHRDGSLRASGHRVSPGGMSWCAGTRGLNSIAHR